MSFFSMRSTKMRGASSAASFLLIVAWDDILKTGRRLA